MADDKKPAETEEKILERARKRFKQAIDAEDVNRGKQKDDMKFLASTPDDNYQWPKDIIESRRAKGKEGGIRPCLTINKMRPHQHQVLNEIRMNRPQIVARPGDAKASNEVAKALNGWLRHIQVASEADLAVDEACNWQTGAGEGFFRMYPAYADEMSFEQTVVFEAIRDRFKVYMDPIGLMKHPAGRKCQWGFLIEDLPKDDYEAQYGEENAIDWNLAGKGDQQDWFPEKDTVRVAEYFEIEQRAKVISEWTLPDGTTTVTVQGSPEDLKYQHAGVQAVGPQVAPQPVPKKTNERKTKIPRCIWRKMNGLKVIDTKEMPTKYVPIVRVVGNEYVIDGELTIDGMIRPAKDAQRMYNYNASTEIEVNALQPKAPITAMVEQIKGHEDKYRVANTVPLAFLPYNAVRNEDGSIANVAPPMRVQAAMPPAAFIQAKIGADNDIKATMGQWGPALGEPSGEKSGKAINARKVESDVGSYHYVDNVARALRYAGTIALDMGAEIIDSKRILRILGEDGEPDHIIVDPNSPEPYMEVDGPDGKKIKVYNFALGKYEVIVNTGPSYTTRRAEAADFLTTAVQAARDPATANVLAYLAMKNQDWSGADEAVTLLKTLLPPQAQQALQKDDEGGGQLPPEAQAAVDQLKHAVGEAHGQLDTAKKALAERDQVMKGLEADLKNKNVEALAKMYEADKKAMAEVTKAQADVMVARAEVVQAAVAQPGNADLQTMVQALDKVLGEMGTKIAALEQSCAQIAGQLQTFEIAARMPQQPQGQAMVQA